MRLAAAGNAAAGTAHHFDEVQVLAPGADLVQQRLALPRPLTTATPSSMPSMFTRASLTPSSRARRDLQVFQLLAGHQVVGGADRRLHHAAGGAEILPAELRSPNGVSASSGCSASRSRPCRRIIRASSRVVSTASTSAHAVAAHLSALRLELLGRAGHDRHAEDLRRIDPLALGKEGLDDRPHHLLRALAGREVADAVRVEVFHELDPARANSWSSSAAVRRSAAAAPARWPPP